MGTIDIFYKTYYKDFEWLNYSLQSLTKYVTGYNKIIILVPERFKNMFTPILPPRTEVHFVPDEGVGYLRQQAYKMQAWKYSDADYILFADSDCLFDHPVNLQDLPEQPVILYTDYELMETVENVGGGNARCWQACTEKFIGRPVQYEFMRRNFLVYLRNTLINIDAAFPNLINDIMASTRFSEFNFIGAYCWFNEPHYYKFINTESLPYPVLGRQFWSHDKIDGKIKLEIEKILHLQKTN